MSIEEPNFDLWTEVIKESVGRGKSAVSDKYKPIEGGLEWDTQAAGKYLKHVDAKLKAKAEKKKKTKKKKNKLTLVLSKTKQMLRKTKQRKTLFNKMN